MFYQFPGGSDGRPGFDPWVGKIPWRWEWLPTPVYWFGEFHRQRSLAGYSPWGGKECNRAEGLTLSLSHLEQCWNHSDWLHRRCFKTVHFNWNCLLVTWCSQVSLRRSPVQRFFLNPTVSLTLTQPDRKKPGVSQGPPTLPLPLIRIWIWILPFPLWLIW